MQPKQLSHPTGYGIPIGQAGAQSPPSVPNIPQQAPYGSPQIPPNAAYASPQMSSQSYGSGVPQQPQSGPYGQVPPAQQPQYNAPYASYAQVPRPPMPSTSPQQAVSSPPPPSYQQQPSAYNAYRPPTTGYGVSEPQNLPLVSQIPPLPRPIMSPPQQQQPGAMSPPQQHPGMMGPPLQQQHPGIAPGYPLSPSQSPPVAQSAPMAAPPQLQHQPPQPQYQPSQPQYQPSQPQYQPSQPPQPQYAPQVSSPRAMYASQPAAAPPKMSAAQMPNVVAVQESDEARYSGETTSFRSTIVADILPPLPTTETIILDDGNCGPNFMRSTMYHIPNTEDLCISAKMPLALIVQPFAKARPHQSPVPLVDFGEEGPIRCTRCRAYINLFVKFLRGGRSYECNICSMVNDVPDAYFCNLDASGRRIDIQQRPELLYGSIDVVASKEYILRKPERPFLLFAIDASRSAIQNGAFASALAATRIMVEEHLRGGPSGRIYGRMAIITYDKNISVYDLRANEPQILVMSDIHEPFVPIHDGLFFDPLEASEQVFALLDRLPTLFNETRIVDSCLGAAAAFALEALKNHGGRVALFHTTLPNVGIGLLRNRDSAAVPSSDKVNPLVLPQGDFYSKIGKQAAAHGVSYVLVSTPSGFTDMTTIGQLATATSGHIFNYPKFSSDFSGHALIDDVRKFFLKPFVYDAVLRVRAGSTLQTSEYFGNFSTLNQTDYQFSALDCDQSFAVTFMYDGKLPENEPVTFQCAILYTSSEGLRRIRIHNLSLQVTSLMSNVFRMADLDAYLAFSCKRAISQLANTSIPTLVNHFHIRSAQTLGAYRKHCASTMPQGQLVLPESLKLLPIYCLAFSKCIAFSNSVTHIDTRMSALYNLMSESLAQLSVLFYPRLYPMHRLIELSDQEVLPPRIRLSQEFLEPHGMYLIENGTQLLLWIGNMVDPETLSKMFGVTQITSVPIIHADNLPELNNPASVRARRLISTILARYDQHLELKIIRQSLDPSEAIWQNSLVEDAQASLGPSYVDFLCRLHNQINHEMTSTSLAERTALLSFLQ